MNFNSKDFINDVQSLDDFIQKASNGKLDIDSLYESIKLTADHWVERGGFEDSKYYLKKLFRSDVNTLANLEIFKLYEIFNYPVDWELCMDKLEIDWLGINWAWKNLLDNYNFSIDNLSDFNKLLIYNEKKMHLITDDERRIMQSVSVIDKDKLKNLKEIV